MLLFNLRKLEMQKMLKSKCTKRIQEDQKLLQSGLKNQADLMKMVIKNTREVEVVEEEALVQEAEEEVAQEIEIEEEDILDLNLLVVILQIERNQEEIEVEVIVEKEIERVVEVIVESIVEREKIKRQMDQIKEREDLNLLKENNQLRMKKVLIKIVPAKIKSLKIMERERTQAYLPRNKLKKKKVNLNQRKLILRIRKQLKITNRNNKLKLLINEYLLTVELQNLFHSSQLLNQIKLINQIHFYYQMIHYCILLFLWNKYQLNYSISIFHLSFLIISY